MNYTKGEWKIEELPITKGIVVRSANGELIAAGLEKTNALLIASAPDIYEALRELYKEYLKVTTMPTEASRKTVKALAKAEGLRD